MRWALAGLWVSTLWLAGCFEPVVGAQCADNQTLCGSTCVPAGTCALDGGLDTGSLDSGLAEVELDGGSPLAPVDTASAVDPTADLDAGYDGAATAVDGAKTDVPQRSDGPTKTDSRPDSSPDRALPDTRDGAASDTRRSDAPDAAVGTKDTQDPVAKDAWDATAQDTRDALPVGTPDAVDAPSRPEVSDATGLPDTPSTQTDVQPDTAPVALDSADAQGADRADMAADATDGRLDLLGPDSPPETQPSCPAPQVKCGGVCVDLQTSQTNCGLCGYDCATLPCIGGQCVSCPAEQTLCNEKCVDTSVDPLHCGGCGQVCESGACRFGVCKASTAGHIVVIGHDFQTNNVAMSRLLGNSILFSTEGDVTVVEYVGVAAATPVGNSHVAITQVANTVGRKVTLVSDVSYSASALASQLKSADVFLIQSQTVATNTILIELGQSWASVLGTFVHTGGTIVVLDGSYPINKGTSQIISRAGLMKVSVTGVVNNETCSITAANDPVAASVSPSYSCLQNSVVFSGDGIHVVEDLGRPVVLHVAF